MGNHRLRLENPGGETRLFRYLLAGRKPEDRSNLKLGSQSRDEEFSIGHLRVLYQMEVGFTADDLRVASRLKEEYDYYQQNYSYPVHIEKDSDKFDPDAVRATAKISNRQEEVKKDWKAMRELLPGIRNIDTDLFKHISFNGHPIENGKPIDLGILEAWVAEASGIISTIPDDESGHEKLARDDALYHNFITATRSAFNQLLKAEAPLLSLINDYNYHIENRSEREASVQFYNDYLDLLKKHNV